MGKLHEQDFTLENYDDFYSDHFFQPLTDEDAINAQRVIPRIGWGLDIAKEIGAKHILDLGCFSPSWPGSIKPDAVVVVDGASTSSINILSPIGFMHPPLW